MQSIKVVKTLPWGDEIYKEIPLHKKSANKFYARHARNAEGREYIEFSKFGPIPSNETGTYSQKLRLFSPLQWAQIKHYVENELAHSIGWNLAAAEEEFTSSQAEQRDKNIAKTTT